MVKHPGPVPETLDEKRLEAFVGKVIGDFGGLLGGYLVALGDRVGLFRALAQGPATSPELAQRSGLDERYVREWLHGLAAIGYVTRGPSGTFRLSPEQAFLFAQEGGPCFFGGGVQEIFGAFRRFDDVARAFRDGAGVKPADYPEDFWTGLERFTTTWFENFLVTQWLPKLPEVQRKLEQGCVLADVGCGRGRALVKLAQAFPRSRFVGYDVHAPSLEVARAQAKAAGVEDRVRFEQVDAAKGLPAKADVVTMFDVLHDMARPQEALRAIRQALQPGGALVLLEINCADRPEDNVGPVAALLYGISVAYCMSASLGEGGAGLGTMGASHAVLRDLGARAGFREVRRIDIGNPFNVLYELPA